MRYFIIAVFLLIIQKNQAQSISVDQNTYTPQQLVEDILINSGCASVTNVTVSGGNFPSGDKSYGYFNRDGSSFPLEDGIILSTGRIYNAPGPNAYISDDGNGIGWNGDSDLNQALNISNSINATILEFDFTPLGNRISFDYIFSSEEYHGTATCQYSDGFAFLLREVGSTNYQNLALIPNTNIPVKVTTVHPNIPGGCGPQNEQYFDSFNDINHPTNFNGQTKTLTAQATVTPGHQYHIKLVIADEGNYRYDSAIFLKAGSFNTSVNLGEDRTIANGNPACGAILLDTQLNGTHQWFLDGNEIIGETTSTLTVTQDGTYTVIVSIPGCSQAPTDDIIIEFAPTLVQNTNDPFTECDADDIQDGITMFDLSLLLPQIISNLPSNYELALFESPTATTPVPLLYQNSVPYQQPLYAKVINIADCYDNEVYPILLEVATFTEDYSDETLGLCENNSIVLDAGSGFSSYSWNTTPIQTSQSIVVSTEGDYAVTLENASGCFKTKTFHVIGSQIATIENIVINDFSENNTATIFALGSGLYEYSLNGLDYQDSPIFENLLPGKYTVYVNDKNNCGFVTETFYILDYPKFFTPNGDGYNDTWQIENLDKNGLENSNIYIFDRFGKLLKQINPLGNGWNGTYNGELLPSSDYWFVLELSNGKTIRNHFSMKR
ncbi:T9SS type B sorting domain-containing protein [Flavobacterium sp. TP390]|uniref:T9SS type B sorting domain-containing protein n=1 Tax=Flavobacterium profundi TaxID=1774945 RepID=A0A6I4ITY8_9FLAO|nr:choice-of-anchor L domain-containing protein [Flavobacterium profundi]MVO10333.1 T9SS type B sorting domain-containing protein [Flavobacterium profundi]